MISINIENISKNFIVLDGKEKKSLSVIESFSTIIHQGSIICLFGPNGCGKTTLLNIVAGLLEPTSGQISFKGDDSHGDHYVGYVFQDYRNSLLPWFNIIENISLPLSFLGVHKEKRYKITKELIQALDISIPIERYPYELSGGQQQLVCIIRAMVHNPALLVLDEPFNSLDYSSRIEMHDQVQKIWMSLKPTVFMVSHDVDEAILLGDEVIVLSPAPMRILAKIPVNFERPRKRDIMESVEFFDLRRDILRTIREAYDK